MIEQHFGIAVGWFLNGDDHHRHLELPTFRFKITCLNAGNLLPLLLPGM